MSVLAAISYLLETESQRRKQGLHSRVSFQDKKLTDQDFQSTGTLELRGQNKKSCQKVKLQLQVPAAYQQRIKQNASKCSYTKHYFLKLY